MDNKLPITETSTRNRVILKIEALEILEPTKEGVQLNEGYQYDIDGGLAQIADGIAKMAIEMDKSAEFGEGSGKLFLGLINQYYENEKGGSSNETTRV